MTPRKLPQPRNVAGITGLIIEEAPKDFVKALACLMDESVAKKAFLVGYKCRR